MTSCNTWKLVYINLNILGEIPWGRFDTESVRQKVVQDKEQLQIEAAKMPDVFKIILQFGLQLDPLHRKLQICNIRNILSIPAKVINIKVMVKPIHLFCFNYLLPKTIQLIIYHNRTVFLAIPFNFGVKK